MAIKVIVDRFGVIEEHPDQFIVSMLTRIDVGESGSIGMVGNETQTCVGLAMDNNVCLLEHND